MTIQDKIDNVRIQIIVNEETFDGSAEMTNENKTLSRTLSLLQKQLYEEDNLPDTLTLW